MSRAIVWLRRDLRLDDNVALFEACARHDHVCLAFVLNPRLLASPTMGAPLVMAFLDALAGLRADLRALGSDLVLLVGDFETELPALAKQLRADAVYYNADYEPSAIVRDRDVRSALERSGVGVHACTDHVYFGSAEIQQNSGGTYRVFTPYKRRWLDMRAVAPRLPVPSKARLGKRLLPGSELPQPTDIPTLVALGFTSTIAPVRVREQSARDKLDTFLEDAGRSYATDRDIPGIEGTSRLSVDLRAGTIGIRTCVERGVAAGADTWVSELIWRDFYQMILSVYPRVEVASFQPVGDRIAWRDAPEEFAAWCDGRTGYPIVDAGMRQLNQTGWMHNRLRMIVASFLTKHLLIDWRRGARYFETHLIDADLAANNGGWQWAASTGTDAVPYFRIFNPTIQAKNVDPNGEFVSRMIPELGTSDYPAPIVDHAFARARALEAFKRA